MATSSSARTAVEPAELVGLDTRLAVSVGPTLLGVTVASFVISCLAALAALAAVWFGRGQKRAAERAADEARRAADAAARVAEIEAQRRAEEVATADRNRVRFVLLPRGGSSYVLHNEGSDTAYQVDIDAGSMSVQGLETHFDEFPSRHSCDVALGRSFTTYGETVRVTWRMSAAASAEQHEVRLHVP